MPDLSQACFLSRRHDSLAGCRRHGTPFAGTDADDFLTFGSRPASALGSGDSGSTRCGDCALLIATRPAPISGHASPRSVLGWQA
jgi:hypothetical protein